MSEREEWQGTSHFFSLRDEMLAELERLRQIMNGDINEYEEEIGNLSEEEKEYFLNFIECFSECPICGKENHKNNLKKFYFDKNPINTRLRKCLFNLMEKPELTSYNSRNKITLGIPCCDCFKFLFGD